MKNKLTYSAITIAIIICISLLLIGVGINTKNTTTPQKNIDTTKIEKNNENKTSEQQKTNISSKYALTRIYPSWDNTYYALLQEINEEECMVVIQNMNGIRIGFESDMKIKCTVGMGYITNTLHMGWIDETVFAIETTPGQIKILDVANASVNREKTIEYVHEQWRLQQISRKHKYMLMHNKIKCCTPVIFDNTTKKPILTISMPENIYANSYYDYINDGFLIYWRQEKFENESQQVNMVMKYIDLASLKEKNLLTTNLNANVGGTACYPDMLIPQKGAIRYISGCEDIINYKPGNNKGILIKI